MHHAFAYSMQKFLEASANTVSAATETVVEESSNSTLLMGIGLMAGAAYLMSRAYHSFTPMLQTTDAQTDVAGQALERMEPVPALEGEPETLERVTVDRSIERGKESDAQPVAQQADGDAIVKTVVDELVDKIVQEERSALDRETSSPNDSNRAVQVELRSMGKSDPDAPLSKSQPKQSKEKETVTSEQTREHFNAVLAELKKVSHKPLPRVDEEVDAADDQQELPRGSGMQGTASRDDKGGPEDVNELVKATNDGILDDVEKEVETQVEKNQKHRAEKAIEQAEPSKVESSKKSVRLDALSTSKPKKSIDLSSIQVSMIGMPRSATVESLRRDMPALASYLNLMGDTKPESPAPKLPEGSQSKETGPVVEDQVEGNAAAQAKDESEQDQVGVAVNPDSSRSKRESPEGPKLEAEKHNVNSDMNAADRNPQDPDVEQNRPVADPNKQDKEHKVPQVAEDSNTSYQTGFITRKTVTTQHLVNNLDGMMQIDKRERLSKHEAEQLFSSTDRFRKIKHQGGGAQYINQYLFVLKHKPWNEARGEDKHHQPAVVCLSRVRDDRQGIPKSSPDFYLRKIDVSEVETRKGVMGRIKPKDEKGGGVSFDQIFAALARDVDGAPIVYRAKVEAGDG